MSEVMKKKDLDNNFTRCPVCSTKYFSGIIGENSCNSCGEHFTINNDGHSIIKPVKNIRIELFVWSILLTYFICYKFFNWQHLNMWSRTKELDSFYYIKELIIYLWIILTIVNIAKAISNYVDFYRIYKRM